MAEVLGFYNFTGTVVLANLNDPSGNYHLLWGEWAPAVAAMQRRRANLPPVADVTDAMQLRVTGATSSGVLGNLQDLVNVIRNADRFFYDEYPSQTLIRYQPTDSNLAAAPTALVLGLPVDEPEVELPRDFDALADDRGLQPVGLRFRRSGYWYGATESNGGDGAVAQGTVASLTFSADALELSPYVLTITGFNHEAVAMGSGFLMLAADDADISRVAGETGSPSGITFTNVADTTYVSRGGEVGRATATGTSYANVSFLPTAVSHHLVGIYATVRNNNASRTWKMYCETKTAAGVVNGRTETIVIDGSSTSPQPVFFGYVRSAAADHTQLVLYLAPDSAVSATIDFDDFWLVGLDSDVNRVIALLGDSTISSVAKIVIDPRQLTARSPRITAEDTSTPKTYDMIWRGDAWLSMRGTTLSCCIVMTRSTYWQWTTAAGAASNIEFDAVRQLAYLTPR